MHRPILVTGGAGFIGSNFILRLLAQRPDQAVINLDKLTYAGNAGNLASVMGSDKHIFVHGDITDAALVRDLFEKYQPCAVVHFAAESHVDRSILGPEEFIKTNVTGTFTLLEESREYVKKSADPQAFRFLHVSTDEVFGSLSEADAAFTEESAYRPNSPYSASKAGSDHLVRAYVHTFELPCIITNCSNNYGPYQFPEKLIPLVILNALAGKPLPIYGNGKNVRDWLYVEDHCDALIAVLEKGAPGETYNIGGNNQKTNLEVVNAICEILDELLPNAPNVPHRKLIQFVKDRPGHDRRYAMDSRKLEAALGWKPEHRFEEGLRKTVEWYLAHRDWTENVVSGAYRDWMRRNYDERSNTVSTY